MIIDILVRKPYQGDAEVFTVDISKEDVEFIIGSLSDNQRIAWVSKLMKGKK